MHYAINEAHDKTTAIMSDRELQISTMECRGIGTNYWSMELLGLKTKGSVMKQFLFERFNDNLR